MAAITVSTALTEMRALLRDNNANAPAFTDAQGIETLNMAYLWWHESLERRTHRYSTASPVPINGDGADGDWGPFGTLTLNADFTTDVAEILELGLDGNNLIGFAGTTIPLQRMGWSELRARQAAAGTTFTDTGQRPTHWAALKLQETNSWKIALYPQPGYEDGASELFTILGVVRLQPTELANTTDTLDLGDAECRYVIWLACILMAPLIGRAEIAEPLKQMLPAKAKEKMESTRTHDEIAA